MTEIICRPDRSPLTIEVVAEAVMGGLARIDPRDRRDTEAHMSQETARLLVQAHQGVDLGNRYIDGSMLFGMTVRQDDTMDLGEVRYVTENAQDRAIRRARRDGITVNVQTFSDLYTVPAPDPTLRALLAHWWRRVRS